mgnify:CR=1 FL=1
MLVTVFPSTERVSRVSDRPEIVCICGSIRFADEMRGANRDLTFAGVIVVAPGEADEVVKLIVSAGLVYPQSREQIAAAVGQA